MNDKNKTKADKLIAKGDKLKEKGKFKKALEKYKEASEYDPERVELLDKLIETHDSSPGEWTEEDVADSVSWVMEKQAVEDPAIKLLHEKLTPEWEEINNKITELVICKSGEEECNIIYELKAYGEKAIYPLISTLLEIKHNMANPEGEECIKGE